MSKKYDAILFDVFRSLSIPFHLTTVQAIEKVFTALNPGGVVVINLLSALEGSHATFFHAQVKTLSTVFPYIYAFKVDQSAKTTRLQNIIIVGHKSEQKASLQTNSLEMKMLLDAFYEVQIQDRAPVLTDEYAPVDFWVAKSLTQR